MLGCTEDVLLARVCDFVYWLCCTSPLVVACMWVEEQQQVNEPEGLSACTAPRSSLTIREHALNMPSAA